MEEFQMFCHFVKIFYPDYAGWRLEGDVEQHQKTSGGEKNQWIYHYMNESIVLSFVIKLLLDVQESFVHKNRIRFKNSETLKCWCNVNSIWGTNALMLPDSLDSQEFNLL